MRRKRVALWITEEDASHLEAVLEQHLEGLEQVNPAVCEDPSIPDLTTLLEITAATDYEATVLSRLKGRIHDCFVNASRS